MIKKFVVGLAFVYRWTAQFVVHAFVMCHPEPIVAGGCDHAMMHHDVADSSEPDHDESSLCLTQSEGLGTLLSDCFFDQSYRITSDAFLALLSDEGLMLGWYPLVYRLKDPGWGDHGVFSFFVDQMYGHGWVMHC